MYTLPKNTEITCDVLKKVIEYNELFKSRYKKLEDYYLGRHEITKRKKEDRLSNNKIVVNHAKYITDTNVGYLLGNPVEYQAGEGNNIEAILDAYKKQTINDLDSELAKDLSVFGIQYEYIFADEEANPKSCIVDNGNAIVVYDDTVEHKKLFGLIYRKVMNGRKFSHYEVIYCNKNTIKTYRCEDKKLKQIDEDQPHTFGDVPIIEYHNNPELQGDFEQVIPLIDAYNLLQSDRINDKEQLVDAILCLYGMDFDDDQAEMLRDSRMLANIPEDGKVEYLVKTLQESEVDILSQTLEKLIHKISMTPNMSDENFAANSSGVAIKYKLLSFEQNIKNKQRYMEKGLMERFKLYNSFLVSKSKMSLIEVTEVDAIFKRNLPANDFETSQMLNNLADFVDKETLVGQLSFIKDAKEIVELRFKEAEDERTEPYNLNFGGNQITDSNEV